jgi:hypothetical protein
MYGRKFLEVFYRNKGVIPNSFSLSVVTKGTVIKYLNKLGANKATGLDGIPARFIKDSVHNISEPLTHIINLSIITGIVPDDLKSARVVPLYKKNNKTEAGNYRPVSILSVVSKVLERIIYDQVESYLTENKLLYTHQSGFRRKYSTDTCLLHLTDFIKFEMDKGNYVGMVLLDLQKAFDTVDHDVLLMKLEAMGFSSDVTHWFRSYLSSRTQMVNVSGILSSSANITCGVPQGSILGPLLFLIYVNDMEAVVRNKLLLYADDSGILVSGKDIQYITSQLTDDLTSISKWLTDNKLSLHLGKTESILFASKPKLRSCDKLDIVCNETSISSTKSVKYLGVNLDQSLSGESTANQVIKKANAKLKFLYRKSSFLNRYTKQLLVSSLIQCHFDYACASWYLGLSQALKNRLQATQNKMLRFILDLSPRTHIGMAHFEEVGWLPVHLRVNSLILGHVHKIHSNSAPSYLNEYFILANEVHSYSTRFRDSNSYFIPRVKGFGKKSFAYNGCQVWNSLPPHLRSISSNSQFKKSVKEHFMQSIPA